MAKAHPRTGLKARHSRWTVSLLICLAWMALIALFIFQLKTQHGIKLAFLALGPILLTFTFASRGDRVLLLGATEERTDQRWPVSARTAHPRIAPMGSRPGETGALNPQSKLTGRVPLDRKPSGSRVLTAR
jgi:hypothetical protein